MTGHANKNVLIVRISPYTEALPEYVHLRAFYDFLLPFILNGPADRQLITNEKEHNIHVVFNLAIIKAVWIKE